MTKGAGRWRSVLERSSRKKEKFSSGTENSKKTKKKPWQKNDS